MMVRRMREIRDQLSLELMDMSFEEEKQFINEQLDKLKKQKKARNNG